MESSPFNDVCGIASGRSTSFSDRGAGIRLASEFFLFDEDLQALSSPSETLSSVAFGGSREHSSVTSLLLLASLSPLLAP
ncbi:MULTISPECIES: hypothetical protein [unclassified Caballeronia]|uniref:hypothetical protein n=1 Tax=unclassified Caballeronia TaxID=2646786 RepID=UPI002855F882|nr:MULTISPECIES: hypothetical protein [unclassified Caballeronia]MDR5776256.1 hypothetical protein [Caballeronia sp. LZ002]MDR5851696.1 hypothetical protein [Caballeronia sp. LZ003]